MKRGLLLLVSLLISFCQQAQSKIDFLTQSAQKTYTTVTRTAIPTFTSTATITDAVGPTLESGEISPSGRRQILVTGPTYANSLIPNALIGSSGSPYQFKSLDVNNRTTLGGDVLTTGQQVTASLNSSNYVYYYSLNFTGDSNSGVSGISGAAFTALSTGAHVGYFDIVATNLSYAGLQINSGSNSLSYADFILEGYRVFGYVIEGEGAYLGSTDTNNHSEYTGTTTVYNFLAYNKGREGIQFAGHHNVDASHITCVNVGQAGVALDQIFGFQFQNSHGTITKSIFDGSGRPMNLASHDLYMEDMYFHWTGGSGVNASGYVANLLTSYPSPITPTNNPSGGSTGKIVCNRCEFDVDVATDHIIWVDDPNVTIEITNSIVDPLITAVYHDNRGASNYSLVGGLSDHGNVVSTPHVPVYSNFTTTDYSGHGLITDDYYYYKGMGYRTP